MFPTIIHSPPELSSFSHTTTEPRPISTDSLQQTPQLYHHAANVRAQLRRSDRADSNLQVIFPDPAAVTPLLNATSNSNHVADNDNDDSSSDKEVLETQVDIFVATNALTIFNRAAAAGVQIPYPSIVLHAVRTVAADERAVYMHLLARKHGARVDHAGEGDADNNDGDEDCDEDCDGDDDDDDETHTVELTLIPTLPSSSQVNGASANTAADGTSTSAAPMEIGGGQDSSRHSVPLGAGALPQKTAAEAMFQAISKASDLHPDPGGEDYSDDADDYNDGGYDGYDGDDDPIVLEHMAEGDSAGYSGIEFSGGSSSGGLALPPPMPGSGGWITAENAHEFFDEEGNFVGSNRNTREQQQSLGGGAGRSRTHGEMELSITGNGVEQADGQETPLAVNNVVADGNGPKRARLE